MRQMGKKILTDENRKKAVNVLFYAALTIELVLMLVEKSELTFTLESYVFRVTFLLTLLAVLLMKHDKREWIVIAAVFVFTFICYEISGKNDLLRLSAFLMAARDIDLKKAMKYSFYLCIVGFFVIALLSVTGILGQVSMVADYGRKAGEETRYVFGFGHPNTLLGLAYAMILMWLWIYGQKASALLYGTVFVVAGVFAFITRSRTGVAVLAATLILAVILRVFPKISEKKALYVLVSIVTPVLCLLIAVLAAEFSQMFYIDVGFLKLPHFWRVDSIFNFRMSNLYYGVPDHGGILQNWRLFAGRGADGYFDMGWVRLFYWYGIIPTLLISVAVAITIYVCMLKKDGFGALLILSLSVYTIIEATFITRYLGRDFFLLIAGVYLGYFFRNKLFGIKEE